MPSRIRIHGAQSKRRSGQRVRPAESQGRSDCIGIRRWKGGAIGLPDMQSRCGLARGIQIDLVWAAPEVSGPFVNGRRSGEIEGICVTLEYLANHRSALGAMGTNGRQLAAREFDRDLLADRFVTVLEQVGEGICREATV